MVTRPSHPHLAPVPLCYSDPTRCVGKQKKGRLGHIFDRVVWEGCVCDFVLFLWFCLCLCRMKVKMVFCVCLWFCVCFCGRINGFYHTLWICDHLEVRFSGWILSTYCPPDFFSLSLKFVYYLYVEPSYFRWKWISIYHHDLMI